MKHILNQHQTPAVRTSWSPDDNELLTCGMDAVRRWEVKSGQCLHVYQKPGITMISCAWLPDGKYIVCGMVNWSVCLWEVEVDGAESQSWTCKQMTANVLEMATIGDQFIIICTEHNILLLNRHTNVWSTAIHEVQPITSFWLSEDNKFLLVDLLKEEIHLWNVEKEPHLVYAWNRATGTPLGTLSGHTGIVNCFSWNLKNSHMLPSASADRTIRIWDLE
ncbi:hypothetical protein ACH5RR_003923 [Cinchona calisaya]|uniref:Uncharacterized protein n=1 Tax=Cinchona calisaya TaxID=153742 RepID=A0ABD3AW32_9GENT